MLKEQALRISKWINLGGYFAINYALIAVISMLRFDRTRTDLFQIAFKFDFLFTLAVISGTIIIHILFLYALVYLMFRQQDLFEIYPRDQLPLSLYQYYGDMERYNRKKVVSLVQRVAKASNVEVSKIFLTVTPVPNAFTVSIPLVGSIANINSNILDVFPEKEVEAIVAHEIGHIRNHDSLIKLLIMAPSTFLHISLAYIYLLIGVAALSSLILDQDYAVAIIRVFLLVIVYLFARFFSFIGLILILKGERKAELLSDLHAASITSPLVTINMLIRLGQRTEALSALMEQFHKMEFMQRTQITQEDQQRMLGLLSSFPPTEIDERKAKLMAPFLYLVDQLNRLRQIYSMPLSDEQIRQLATISVENLIRQGKIALDTKNTRAIRKIAQDWRAFDFDQDAILNPHELQQFVLMLRNNPERFLFSSEASTNYLLADHPNFRERILMIYDTYRSQLQRLP